MKMQKKYLFIYDYQEKNAFADSEKKVYVLFWERPVLLAGSKERNMAKLKDEILQSAKQLFQEKGYEGVSLRAIAEHAGTTIGNLTYHYPQKEDLLVAMQLSTQGEALTHFGNLPPTAEGILREMVMMCYLTEEICTARAFYFANILKLCQDVPSLKKHVEETRDLVNRIYLERFFALRDRGVMRADVPDSVYEALASSYLLSVTSWLNVKRLFSDRASQASMFRLMTDLAYPLLTEEGKKVMAGIEERMDALLAEARERLKKIL